MFERLGNAVSRYWLLVILLWIAGAGALRYVAPRWDDVTNDGDLAYLPEQMTSVRGERLLAEAFPDQKSKSQIVLIVARDDQPLDPLDLDYLDRIAAKFEPDVPHGLPIVGLWTPSSDIVGKKLLSPDRRCALAIVQLTTEFMAVRNLEILRDVKQVLDTARRDKRCPRGLVLGVSGSAAIGGDMLTSAAESIEHIETMTIGMVLVILALVYGTPVLVIVPLVTLVVSVMVATDVVASLAGLAQSGGVAWFTFKIFKTTKIFIVTILFGSGTDFCLFLIARYREELERGLERGQALAQALGQVGDAITASAMTTICGLGMMFFADFGKFRNSGPAIGMCLAVALLACLTLAPALLRLFGGVVFWPWGVKVRTGEADDRAIGWTARFWNGVGRMVIAHPGLILVASVVLFAPLAYAGRSVSISYNLLGDMDPARPSVVGTRLLERHFAAGELGPVIVVVYLPGARFDQEAGKTEIARLTKSMYDIEGVSAVRSLAEPLGDRPGLFNPLSPAGRRKLAALRNPRTKARFMSQTAPWAGQVTIFDIVLDQDPFSPVAAATLGKLDSWLEGLAADPQSAWNRAHFEFVGVTAGTRDLKAVTQSDERLIQRLVTLAVLAILIVLLKRPIICIYLIASVLFSYAVTIGTTQLVFGYLYPDLLGLDWKVPIFLFVILIAVGEDYNIFLATRVAEEQRKYGPLEGIAQAVARTGGIITSCGVIMAGTFVSMMSGTLRAMQELGFALTLGVMLDTLLVRPILVPAFLALVDGWSTRYPKREAITTVTHSGAEDPGETAAGFARPGR